MVEIVVSCLINSTIPASEKFPVSAHGQGFCIDQPHPDCPIIMIAKEKAQGLSTTCLKGNRVIAGSFSSDGEIV